MHLFTEIGFINHHIIITLKVKSYMRTLHLIFPESFVYSQLINMIWLSSMIISKQIHGCHRSGKSQQKRNPYRSRSFESPKIYIFKRSQGKVELQVNMNSANCCLGHLRINSFIIFLKGHSKKIRSNCNCMVYLTRYTVKFNFSAPNPPTQSSETLDLLIEHLCILSLNMINF